MRRRPDLALPYIIKLEDPDRPLEKVKTTRTPEQVAAFVAEAASLTKSYAHRFLTDDRMVGELVADSDRRRQEIYDRPRAEKLRSTAEAAWRRQDLDLVEAAYTEIKQNLPTVELRPSEAGRLAYARKHRTPVHSSGGLLRRWWVPRRDAE